MLVLMWLSILLAVVLAICARGSYEPVIRFFGNRLEAMIITFLLIAVILCVGQSLAGRYAQWRKAKRVIRARGQMCVFCFYDLSQRPRDHDTCPECGQFTPRRECVRLWCRLLRTRF